VLGLGGIVDIVFILMLLTIVGGMVMFAVLITTRARRFGYPSTRAYLRAAPRSDPERRDAADLALKGLVFCLLGLMFAPFILVGVFPLFYGARKLMFASMGLGLVDDADQREA
jgi:hypothetical protein